MAKDAKKHLAPMVLGGLIVWNDEQIKPNAMRRDELETALLEKLQSCCYLQII
jgi:hypothetical protein